MYLIANFLEIAVAETPAYKMLSERWRLDEEVVEDGAK